MVVYCFAIKILKDATSNCAETVVNGDHKSGIFGIYSSSSSSNALHLLSSPPLFRGWFQQEEGFGKTSGRGGGGERKKEANSISAKLQKLPDLCRIIFLVCKARCRRISSI